MIVQRRIARKLLDEFIAACGLTETQRPDGSTNDDTLRAIRDELLEESDLVLRGTENAEQKARRYLTEGRLVVQRVDPESGYVIASCAGEEGDYRLGHDPGKNEWRCTCPAPGKRCSHLIALRLVVRPC